MKELREGYTTGTCAAAAAKAAAIAIFRDQLPSEAEVTLLQGQILKIPVKNVEVLEKGREAKATVIKDAGDDPDITHGKEIVVTLRVLPATDIHIKNDSYIEFTAGEGVGTVTKPGLPVPVGEPAINPNPRRMIQENLTDFLTTDRVLQVEISVPEGAALARKTLNPHLGILGGISILGTTGIVKPMSEEAFKVSLVPQLKKARAMEYETIVLTPGNIGLETAVKYGIPRDAIAVTSNFIGYMLENAADSGFPRILLWGHMGKLIKVSGGNFYTHNRISDSRMEIIAAALALQQAPVSLIKEVLEHVTTEGAYQSVEGKGYDAIWPYLAEQASIRAERFLFSRSQVGAVFFKDREGLLCMDQRAKEILELEGWK